MALVQFKYNEAVAKKVREVAMRAGTKKEAYNTVVGMDSAPSSYSAFDKHYGELFNKTKAEYTLEINGSALGVVKDAIELDRDKDTAKWWLERRSKDFNKTTEQEVKIEVSVEERAGVANKLAASLGFGDMIDITPEEVEQKDAERE